MSVHDRLYSWACNPTCIWFIPPDTPSANPELIYTDQQPSVRPIPLTVKKSSGAQYNLDRLQQMVIQIQELNDSLNNLTYKPCQTEQGIGLLLREYQATIRLYADEYDNQQNRIIELQHALNRLQVLYLRTVQNKRRRSLSRV